MIDNGDFDFQEYIKLVLLRYHGWKGAISGFNEDEYFAGAMAVFVYFDAESKIPAEWQGSINSLDNKEESWMNVWRSINTSPGFFSYG